MARRHHYRRRGEEPAELDMTTFLNLMVVLVPFLLITAVFSRITIVNLSLPSAVGGPTPKEIGFRLEVIVRKDLMQVSNGAAVIDSIPKVDGHYDMAQLSSDIVALKDKHPDADAASVLLEPDIAYDHLIQVMDVVRGTEVPGEDGSGPVQKALFTDIAIGDAP